MSSSPTGRASISAWRIPASSKNHLIATARFWTTPEKALSLIHGWMRDQANVGVAS